MTPYALTKKIRACSPVPAQLQLEMALAKVRAEAFEEAAKIAEIYGPAGAYIAKQIRELVLANQA